MRGRPRKEDARRINFHIRFNEEEYKLLKDLKKKTNIPTSELIRSIIRFLATSDDEIFTEEDQNI